MWLIRNGNKVQNLPHFPFPRVVHYFYDLKKFPRVEGHPSYVFHIPNTLLNWTYKQDHITAIGETLLEKVLNRKYFLLAYLSQPQNTIPKTMAVKNVS